MKTLQIIYLAIVVTAAAAFARADALPLLPPEIPTSSTRVAEEVFARYAMTASELVAPLTAKLKTQKDDEDTTARYMIGGLIWHLGKHGTRPEKLAMGKALVAAVPSANGIGPKVFLLEQLQYLSDPSLAGDLYQYLKDEKLANQTLRTLLVTAPPDLAGKLLESLKTAPPGTQAAILNALSRLNLQSGTEQIASYVQNNDTLIKVAALDALAAIGDPESKKAIQNATLSASSYYDSLAPARYLYYARRLHERGNATEAAAICRELISATDTTETAHIKSAAFQSLVDITKETALPDLIKAVDSDNEETRAAALHAIARLTDLQVTRQLVRKLKTNTAPEVSADILLALGKRGDKSALTSVLAALTSNDSNVRVAAVKASGQLARSSSIPVLLHVLQSADKELCDAVGEELARATDPRLDTLLAGALDSSSSAGKVILIDTMAKRRLAGGKDAVFKKTNDPEVPVRTAAFKALETLSETSDLPRLLDLLLTAERSTDRNAARRAYVATARKLSNEEQRAALLLERYPSASAKDKPVLLGTLPQLGGSRALETVQGDLETTESEIREAAVRALSEWQTTAALPQLQPIAFKSEEVKLQVLALRGLVRIASELEDTAEKLKLLSGAITAAKRPEETQLVLAALADVATTDALTLVTPFIGKEGVAAEAAAAAAKIALPRTGHDTGLTGSQTADALKRALPAMTDNKVRKKVEDHLARIGITQ